MPYRLVVSLIFWGATNFTIFSQFCNFRSFRNFRSIRLCLIDLLFPPIFWGTTNFTIFRSFRSFCNFAVFSSILYAFRTCILTHFSGGQRILLFFAVFAVFVIFRSFQQYPLRLSDLYFDPFFWGTTNFTIFSQFFAVFAAACNPGHYSPYKTCLISETPQEYTAQTEKVDPPYKTCLISETPQEYTAQTEKVDPPCKAYINSI